MLAVNLTGTFLCAQAVFPHLQASRHGRIINISSLAGRTGGVTVGLHYSASKGGVISMTKALARMLAPSGGTVNCIAPGPLDTPMTADWPPENREMLRQQIPLAAWVVQKMSRRPRSIWHLTPRLSSPGPPLTLTAALRCCDKHDQDLSGLRNLTGL